MDASEVVHDDTVIPRELSANVDISCAVEYWNDGIGFVIHVRRQIRGMRNHISTPVEAVDDSPVLCQQHVTRSIVNGSNGMGEEVNRRLITRIGCTGIAETNRRFVPQGSIDVTSAVAYRHNIEDLWYS